MMKLKTEEFEELFKDHPLYSQENEEDSLVVAKLFDPCSAATWYLTEYDPVEKIAFCYVTGLKVDEWGYTSLAELGECRKTVWIDDRAGFVFCAKEV